MDISLDSLEEALSVRRQIETLEKEACGIAWRFCLLGFNKWER